MLDLQKYADGNVLFDGQYKLLHRLSEAGGTADVWLALAVKTIDTLGDYYDEENSTPNEESGMKVAIKIYRLQNILDIEGEFLSIFTYIIRTILFFSTKFSLLAS